MENKQTKGGNESGKNQPKADITKLPRMEMYAVLGLDLSQKILEKLQSVEDSLVILATQKKRELDSEEPTDMPGN